MEQRKYANYACLAIAHSLFFMAHALIQKGFGVFKVSSSLVYFFKESCKTVVKDQTNTASW